ncbi:MAG: peptide ABC transporter ATP-binding protein [Candidatus Entotheonella factor]|uniref:Peptide ABC transporter ATP-binding protein n=1 Tax=Entotheonella factor TaxID=1429438 RepID=W4LUR9_ENTF1|nr:MAG: peptide ABC transporter ATP-binding protein [Candidatus Entotheonella factor]
MEQPLLDIRALETQFFTDDGLARAVDGVSYSLAKGETVGVVGESGCGKSVTALSVLRLIPNPPGRIVGGEIVFEGTNLLDLSPAEMRRIRGNDISMIFQEPMTSLNPVFTIGNQIGEAVRLHQGLSTKEATNKAIEMLTLVGIPEPARRVHEYPHQLSGGMRQRAMIAMALSCNPKVLIADEPTTALDVTIEAQILDLMRNLQSELGTAVILITHDLGVVAEMARKVVVMYAGKVVEQAPVETIFAEPNHPYTQGLLNSLPNAELGAVSGGNKRRLQEIPGIVPSLLNLPQGCKFASRCPKAMAVCEEKEPPLEQVGADHLSACWLNH